MGRPGGAGRLGTGLSAAGSNRPGKRAQLKSSSDRTGCSAHEQSEMGRGAGQRPVAAARSRWIGAEPAKAHAANCCGQKQMAWNRPGGGACGERICQV